MSHLSFTKRLTAHEETLIVSHFSDEPHPFGDEPLGLFLEKKRITKTLFSPAEISFLETLLDTARLIHG